MHCTQMATCLLWSTLALPPTEGLQATMSPPAHSFSQGNGPCQLGSTPQQNGLQEDELLLEITATKAFCSASRGVSLSAL